MMIVRLLCLALCLAVVGCKATNGKEENGKQGSKDDADASLDGTVPDATQVDDVRAHEAVRQIGFHCGLVLQLPTAPQTTQSFCFQQWGTAETTHEQYVQNMLSGLNVYCGVGVAPTGAIGGNAFMLGAGKSAGSADATTGGLGYTNQTGVSAPASDPSTLLRQSFCAEIFKFLYPSQ